MTATDVRSDGVPLWTEPDQLVPLPGTDWHVWRSAIVRGPGFPADGLDRLSAPDCAAVADEHLRGAAGAERFTAAFDQATLAVAARLCDIAADPLFREAVTWQSLDAARALDGLVREGPHARRNSRHRERESIITRYWQRYCGKNDTIGFFGPVCWVSFDPTAPAVLGGPGPALVRERVVDFEWRALAAYAGKLAADERYRPWLPVVRQPHLALDGDQLRQVGAPPVSLAPAAAAVLAACATALPAAEVVRLVVADPRAGLRREVDGYVLLSQLAEQGLVRWGVDLPFTVRAEEHLRRRLDEIGDPALRTEAVGGLDRLSAARDAVAAAAGDPDALRAALAHLNAEFTDVTGAAAKHRPGETYVGRNLVYEDTVRDLDLTLGGPVLAALAPPLAPLLQAARWLTGAIATAYTDALRELFDETGGGEVSLGELWYLANGVMFSSGPADAVLADFIRRWAALLGLDRAAPGTRRITLGSAELTEAVSRVFPADAPGWSAGRLHSPDLHLCAESLDALARGEFTAVLGELHVAWLTCDNETFVRFHPDRSALRAALRRDLGDRVVLLYPTDFPRLTARITDALVGPEDDRLAYAAAPPGPDDRVLPLAALTVSDVDGVLVARAPDGRTWPLVELVSAFLSALSVDAYKLVGASAHTPRVTVDRLVVQRETWRTTVGATGLVDVRGEADRYLAARRWRAELGLPERVFVRVGTELKPCYVDLTSPAYVAAFGAMVRSAHRAGGADVTVTVTEMLPEPSQAWLPDAAGRRYFSELRIAVRDPQPARPPGAPVHSGAGRSGAVHSGAVHSGAVDSGAGRSGAVDSGAVDSGGPA